jgi:RNA-directed DNA polymerase
MPKAELTIQDGMRVPQEWNQVNWKKLERRVYKLQKRIYQASKRGDRLAVRRLQKTLLHSWAAKMIAVRRVTQENQGKKTAGVDGVKSRSPKATSRLGRPTKADREIGTDRSDMDTQTRQE